MEEEYVWLEKDISISKEEQEQLVPTPDFRIEFRSLLSWNDVLGTARHAGAMQGILTKWRKKGFEQAIFYARRNTRFQVIQWSTYEAGSNGRMIEKLNYKINGKIFKRCELVIRYWRSNWRRYDNFNIFLKPVIDGIIDTGLIADDDFTHFPITSVQFMGVDPKMKLSAEARKDRQVRRISKKTSSPEPARYCFDFYDIP